MDFFHNQVEAFAGFLQENRQHPDALPSLAHQISELITNDHKTWSHLLNEIIDAMEAHIIMNPSETPKIAYVDDLAELRKLVAKHLQEKWQKIFLEEETSPE